MSLLEKAKQISRHSRRPAPTDEVIELAVAWFNGEVTSRQYFAAIGQPVKTNPYAIALILRDAVRDKKAKVEKANGHQDSTKDSGLSRDSDGEIAIPVPHDKDEPEEDPVQP
jgi:hypothetical protein